MKILLTSILAAYCFVGCASSNSGTLASGSTLGAIRKPAQSAGESKDGLELSSGASKVVGELLRESNQSGNKAVEFGGGPQVTTYSVGNLVCFFQNSDGSVSCSTDAELSNLAAETVGNLLRQSHQKNNKAVEFGGGPQVTTYSVGNLVCFFQNTGGSISCSVQ